MDWTCFIQLEVNVRLDGVVERITHLLVFEAAIGCAAGKQRREVLERLRIGSIRDARGVQHPLRWHTRLAGKIVRLISLPHAEIIVCPDPVRAPDHGLRHVLAELQADEGGELIGRIVLAAQPGHVLHIENSARGFVQDHAHHAAGKHLPRTAQRRSRRRKSLDAGKPLIAESDRIFDVGIEDLRLGGIRRALLGQQPELVRPAHRRKKLAELLEDLPPLQPVGELRVAAVPWLVIVKRNV
jgi:hypothetical protein